MIQLNLLPDVKKEFLHVKSMRRKVIATAILVTIVSGAALAAAGLFIVSQEGLIAWRTNLIEEKAEELSSIENIDEYLTIQAQLKQIDGLHSSKLITSKLFDILPSINPDNPNSARFSSVMLSTEGTSVTLSGGVRTVSALTTLRDTMVNAGIRYQEEGVEGEVTDQLFSDVVIQEYGYSADSDRPATRVGFTIIATYNPVVFKPTSQNLRISVPNKETTQSVEASPQVRFEEDAGKLEESDE